jgi:ElaB/YqjD/DUF883 family membrane-anchored ribosome-binding protein
VLSAAVKDQRASKEMVQIMEATNPKVHEDIDALKRDVRRVRDNVVGIVHSAKSRCEDTVMETGGRVREMMADLRDKVKDQVQDKSEALKDRGHETVENWRGGIGHRPLASLLIAFAAGLILAFLVTKRRY